MPRAKLGGPRGAKGRRSPVFSSDRVGGASRSVCPSLVVPLPCHTPGLVQKPWEDSWGNHAVSLSPGRAGPRDPRVWGDYSGPGQSLAALSSHSGCSLESMQLDNLSTRRPAPEQSSGLLAWWGFSESQPQSHLPPLWSGSVPCRDRSSPLRLAPRWSQGSVPGPSHQPASPPPTRSQGQAVREAGRGVGVEAPQ